MTPPNLPQITGEELKSGVIENRVAARSNVTWKARLLSEKGLMMDVKTADISISGVGLIGDHPLTLHSVMQLAIQVPHLTMPGSFTVITGQIKIVFHVLKGGQYRSGGQWINLAEPHQALLKSWIERVPPLIRD